MVAAIGFVLVLVGWAANLSISYWTMAQASLSLAVLTVATVVILASRRVESPIPVAWAGVVLGVFGAILGFGQWGDLIKQGDKVELGATDFGAFLLYAIGLVMIIVGGVMTAARAAAGELRDGLEGRGRTGRHDQSPRRVGLRHDASASARSRIGVPEPP